MNSHVCHLPFALLLILNVESHDFLLSPPVSQWIIKKRNTLQTMNQLGQCEYFVGH